MKKKEYHHGNLKEELINIAFDFIAKEDVDKLTLKILADATNTSRSAIYKHFKNKDALGVLIRLKRLSRFDLETTIYLKDETKALIDKFYLTGELYVKFARDNPNLYRLLFGKKYAYIREEVLSIKDEDYSAFASLKKTVEEGQKQGVLKKDDSYKQAIFMDVEEVYEEIYVNLFETLLFGMVSNKVKIISTIPVLKKILNLKKVQ